MAHQIIINATPQESRVATLDNARLLQIEIERARERGLAGSVFKGRVTRVLPGMQAAFVDIGLEKAAFLPGFDYFDIDAADADDGEHVESPENAEAADQLDGVTDEDRTSSDADGVHSTSPVPYERPPLPAIEERLKQGQDVVVQIAKEPIGTKGSRITSNIALPGRLLVYLPGGDQVRISRRIVDDEERERLQSAVEAVSPNQGGVIVRTACQGVSAEEIQADLMILRRLWQHLIRKAETCAPPALLHRDLDVILRTVRDMAVLEVERIVVDSPAERDRVQDFIEQVMPSHRPPVELYRGADPIFEHYGIETQISRALERRVWLRSGGYIVIDPTEALTSIDVNTGRFVGKRDQRDTALKTNLEAAEAIAEHLSLRNIGGLIVIDFIDMELAADRQEILAGLDEALRRQRTRAEISDFSPVGLVQMTRHRTRQSLTQQLCDPCPTCNEKGYVKGLATTAYEVLRALRHEATSRPAPGRLLVSVHPAVASFLADFEPAAIRDIEQELSIAVALTESSDADPMRYSITEAAALPGAP